MNNPYEHLSYNKTQNVTTKQIPQQQQANSTQNKANNNNINNIPPPPPPGPPPAVNSNVYTPTVTTNSSTDSYNFLFQNFPLFCNYLINQRFDVCFLCILSPPISSNSRSESPHITLNQNQQNMQQNQQKTSIPPWKQPYQAAQAQTSQTAIYSPPKAVEIPNPVKNTAIPSISQNNHPKPMINLPGLSNRKAVGEQAVNLANMLGQVASRKTPITNKPIYDLALTDREAEFGEPCVLEVRVKNAFKDDPCVSVQWYYNGIPVREDLDRDIRVLALTKGANLSVYSEKKRKLTKI